MIPLNQAPVPRRSRRRAAGRRAEPEGRLDLLGGNGPAEQEALDVRAAEGAEQRGLLLRLDALGRHVEAEVRAIEMIVATIALSFSSWVIPATKDWSIFRRRIGKCLR